MGDVIDDPIEDIDTLILDVDELTEPDPLEETDFTNTDIGSDPGVVPDEEIYDVSGKQAVSKDVILDVDELKEPDPPGEPDFTNTNIDTDLGVEPDEKLYDVSGNRAVPKDVILVLDNSGSMKKNDPN
ncbi:MAG: hypothetical protein V3V73_03670, partial [Gammaproteobacteria bacterium]